MALLRVSLAAMVSTRSTRELAPVADGVPQIASAPRRVLMELRQVADDDAIYRMARPRRSNYDDFRDED